MDDLKLTWHDRKGIHRDGDIVARPESYLPDTFAEGRTSRVFIIISREEDGQEGRYRLALKQAPGSGYTNRTFPTVEADERTAEELAANAAAETTETTRDSG